MEIKRIQLRGISRAPSDRITENGGVAESLNVVLDHTESAPVVKPKDVSEELRIPSSGKIKKVFIHKGAQYENTILVKSYQIIAKTDDGTFVISDLSEGEEVNDISSIGNTVIVSTSEGPRYALYKDKKYIQIGSQIPMPTIEFFDVETKIKPDQKYQVDYNYSAELGYAVGLDYPDSLYEEVDEGAQVIKGLAYTPPLGTLEMEEYKAKFKLDKSTWNEINAEDKTNKSEAVKKIVEELKVAKDAMIAANAERGILSKPVWVLYALRLYDGSLITSMPYIMSGGIESPVDIDVLSYAQSYYSYFHIRLNHYYKIGAKLHDYSQSQLESWKDIVKGVDIYVSEDIDPHDWKNIIVDTQQAVDSDAIFTRLKVSGVSGSYIRYANSCETFAKVAEFAIDESFYSAGAESIDVLRNDYVIDMAGKIRTDQRVSEDLLADEDYTVYLNSYSGKATVFNNKVLLTEAMETKQSGPTWLLSQRYNTQLAVPYLMSINPGVSLIPLEEYPSWWTEKKFPEAGNASIESYEIAYSINDTINGEATVYGKSRGGNLFTINHNRYSNSKPVALLWMAYPDSRCNRVDIKANYNDGTHKVRSVDMKPHVYLAGVSHAYGGVLEREVASGTTKELPAENKRLEISNKVVVSKSDNPFFYDVASSYTFQSKVTGLAIAAKALSQGQFGQFPLYVFTEDGIWVMETAADGSFVTSKPLSRDICVNPDSITSIDNAVVFASDKGLMLLSGSEVVNLSSYMHGRHYKMSADARLLVESQEDYKGYIDTLVDETPFLAFLRKAKIAYDYAGNRLICIAADEEYQYIYKLDTKTWHKTKHEADLVDVINSYPECLVMANASVSKKHLWVTNNATQEEPEYIGDRIKVVIPDLRDEDLDLFLSQDGPIDVTDLRDEDLAWLINEMRYYNLTTEVRDWQSDEITRVYDLTTYLDAAGQETEKAVITTRPFDLEYPDTYKSISDIRVRGQYKKGAVKFILEASNDNENFHVIRTVRGQSWKYFRVTILADLEQHDRLSWIDVKFETRLTDKLR